MAVYIHIGCVHWMMLSCDSVANICNCQLKLIISNVYILRYYVRAIYMYSMRIYSTYILH